MPILKDDAQVLQVYEQGNTSLVIVFYGRALGQFRVHGKGAQAWSKKGFAGGFDLLARGEVLVYPRRGESLWILKEWNEAARPAVGQSLAMLYAASYLCEFTAALTRPTAGSVFEKHTPPTPPFQGGEKPGALYALLAAAAEALAAGNERGVVLLGFTLAALAKEGLLPQLDRCGECGRVFERHAKRMWLTGQGLYCEACATGMVPLAETRPFAAQPVPTTRSTGCKLPQPVAPNVRGVWLSIEAQRALKYVAKTAQTVRLSAGAAAQLAQALILLVHGALEQDLRTLPAAARMVRALS